MFTAKVKFFLLALSLAAAPPLAATTHDWDAEPLAAAKLHTVSFRGWIPDVEGPLNGTLVLVPGRHGDGRSMATNGQWQEVARTIRFAIIACRYADGEPHEYQRDPGQSVSKSINTAVAKLAELSGRKELADAPLAFWGTSAGSNVSMNYCEAFPDRVVAFASSKGTGAPGGMTRGKDEIPIFIAVGAKDKPDWVQPSIRNFQAARRAPWSLALHNTEGHDVGRSLDVCRPFLIAAVRQRLGLGEDGVPSRSSSRGFNRINERDGWTGNLETYEIVEASRRSGSSRGWIWLPDQATAEAWQAYLKSGL